LPSRVRVSQNAPLEKNSKLLEVYLLRFRANLYRVWAKCLALRRECVGANNLCLWVEQPVSLHRPERLLQLGWIIQGGSCSGSSNLRTADSSLGLPVILRSISNHSEQRCRIHCRQRHWRCGCGSVCRSHDWRGNGRHVAEHHSRGGIRCNFGWDIWWHQLLLWQRLEHATCRGK